MEAVDYFLKNWTGNKKIGDVMLDELLSLDGVPLWWFFERIFVYHILPRQINTFEEIEKREKLSPFKKIKLKASAQIIKKMIISNENKKLKYFGNKKFKSPDHKPTGDQNKVLFLSYTNHILPNGDLFRIQKIINEVKEKHFLEPFVLFADTLSSRNYKKLNDKNTIYQYSDNDINKKAKTFSNDMYEKWKSISDSKKEELLTKGDLSYWPYLKHAFEVFYSKEFLELLYIYYESAKKTIISEKIKVVVLTSQNGIFDKCIIAAAQELNVPVLRLQHGIGECLIPYHPFDKYYKLIFSEEVKRNLMNVGWPEEQLIITGPIIFDEINNYILPKKNKEKNIFIATAPLITESGGGKKYYQKIESIMKDIKKIKNVKVILKVHPAEHPIEKTIKKYRNCARKVDLRVKIYGTDISRKEFYQLFQWCDVFVNFGSTTALEAMIIGRPAVTIKAIDFPAMYNWMEENKIAPVIEYRNNKEEHEELVSAIKKSLEGNSEFVENIKEFIKKKCGIIEGNAYKKTSVIIKQFYKEQEK